MKFIIKLWGENGHLIGKGLLCIALAIISIICGLVIAPVIILFGYGFAIAACWFCFKYARENRAYDDDDYE